MLYGHSGRFWSATHPMASLGRFCYGVGAPVEQCRARGTGVEAAAAVGALNVDPCRRTKQAHLEQDDVGGLRPPAADEGGGGGDCEAFDVPPATADIRSGD